MIRVLIVDDHAAARRSLRILLRTADDIDVIGEADSGPRAVAAAAELRPDVVLMDVQMPGGDGIEATRQLTAAGYEIPVVLVTSFDRDENIFNGLAAGASGFILKHAETDELEMAIRAAHRGDALLAPAAARKVAAEMRRLSLQMTSSAGKTAALTPREREVVLLVMKGMSNAQIGRELHVSAETVKTYVARVLSKTEMRSRTQLAIWAHQNGMND